MTTTTTTGRHAAPREVTAEITLRLRLSVPHGTTDAALLDALHSLAAVMGVQAEDGLYAAGSPDIDTYVDETGEDVPNEYVADIPRWTETVRTYPTPDVPDAGDNPVTVVTAFTVPNGHGWATDYAAATRATLHEILPDGYPLTPQVHGVAVLTPAAFRTFLAGASVGLDTEPDTAGTDAATLDAAWSTVQALTPDEA